jgi:hypothetical protein
MLVSSSTYWILWPKILTILAVVLASAGLFVLGLGVVLDLYLSGSFRLNGPYKVKATSNDLRKTSICIPKDRTAFVYSEKKKIAMAVTKNPKLSRSDLELLSLSFVPSSFVIVPFFQAATLISPMINFLTMLIKNIAIMIVAMILNVPILFSLGRTAFKSSQRSGGARVFPSRLRAFRLQHRCP